MNLNPPTSPLLNQLQDIQLPEPIGWWPLSFAWWILLFMLVSIAVGLTWYLREQKKRNAYRKEALQRLKTLNNSENTRLSPNQQAIEINQLLKQVALTAYPRTEVAQLNGQAWLDFLAKSAKHIVPPTDLKQCMQLAYQPPSHSQTELKQAQQQLNSLKRYANQWIKGHHQ